MLGSQYSRHACLDNVGGGNGCMLKATIFSAFEFYFVLFEQKLLKIITFPEL